MGVVQTQHWTAADVQSATDHRALYQLQINSLQIGVISLAMYPIMDSPYHYSTWRQARIAGGKLDILPHLFDPALTSEIANLTSG